MRRLPAFLLMFVLLPGLAEAQADARSHSVVRGETLWGLAERFCGDPFRWPEIYQANQSQISNPDLILPGQVFSIACAPAEVGQVQVVTPDPDRPATEPAQPFDERSRPTVFRRNMSTTVGVTERPPVMVMSRDASWSAPWLNLGDNDPWSVGRVSTLLSGESSRTAMPYQRVRVTSDERPRLGDIFQVFRSERLIEGLGTIVLPTGMISVTAVADGGFEGVLLKSYDRVVRGDLVVAAPAFEIEAGDAPTAVSSGATAQILTFGANHVLHQIGDIAMLDKGASDGVSVGDEYVLISGNEGGWSGEVAARFQVVRITDETASARLTQVVHPGFKAGQEIRLDRKMR